MRACLAFVLCLLTVVPARAQLTVTWVPRADLNATLPGGVRVFQTASGTTVTRGGNPDPLRAWLVRADTNGAAWRFGARLASPLKPVREFATETGVLLAMNGGYFGGGASYSLVVDEGTTRAFNIGAVSRPAGTYYPARSAFGLLNSGALDVAWTYNVGGTVYAYPNPTPNTPAAPQPQPTATFPAGGAVWPVRVGLGGGPVLVENGARRVTLNEEVFFGSGIGDDAATSLNPRSAIGYTANGEILMIVAEGRSGESFGLSLTELADLFLQLGAREAMNLDGGGSSQLSVGTTTVYGGDGRSVAAAAVLAPKRTGGGGTTGETFYFDADPASPNYRETGSWIVSANTPFHGTTGSRLNTVGSGDRAVFRFGGLPAGRYEVAAWWVPSSNRATNTPFTVSCTPPTSGGSCTPIATRVNQVTATALGQWNVLGTATLSSADSLVVTDDAAPASAFVVADGVRLVKISEVAAAPEESAASSLRLYPNPAREVVTLDLDAASMPRTASVYNVLGQAVAHVQVAAAGGLIPIRLDGLAPGLYVAIVDGPKPRRATFVVAR